ncbi:MAG: hypothetical protein GXO66_04755 [Euryarchaeota archaeon]|nr:hypothetical protein [Euryarchaeota archaeon]
MRRVIELDEATFRRLVKLKNHWSFQYRRVTNPRVREIIEKLKLEIFGYNSSTPASEVERIIAGKSRDQLEREAEAFARAMDKLLLSGYDFEPEYSFAEHIAKMIEVIENSDAAPVFEE